MKTEPSGHLGPEPNAFFGRADDQRSIHRAFSRRVRLVTLVGPAGAGKTRLALRYARVHGGAFERPAGGGVLFCDLGEARGQRDLLDALAHALATRAPGADAVAAVGQSLAQRGRALVLLDNFEQLVEHAPQTVGRWLDLAREARFLVTSREPLGLGAEHVHEVGPLQLPAKGATGVRAISLCDAVRLFVERARNARPEFALATDVAPAVAEIARQLEGLPLAIELAAARMAILGPAQLLGRLDARLDLLRNASGGPHRHRALRHAIDGSWELLSPTEQTALADLAVFRGGCSVEAAEAVVEVAGRHPPTVIDLLQSLRQKSLLLERATPDATGERRFDLFAAVREYALERLVESGRADAARERHADHFARAAEAWTRAPDGQAAATATREVLADRDNLVEVLRRALDGPPSAAAASRAVAMVAALDRLLSVYGSVAVHLQHLDGALALVERCPERDERSLGTLHFLRGRTKRMDSRTEEARRDLERALAHARTIGDARLEARALIELGYNASEAGALEEARGRHEAALAVVGKLAERGLEARITGALGVILAQQGRSAEARDHYERAAIVFHEVGDACAEGFYLRCLGILAHADGLPTTAHLHFERALAVLGASGHRVQESDVLILSALLDLDEGHWNEARALAKRALSLAREHGFRIFAAFALGLLGVVDACSGRLAPARAQLDDADSLLGSDEDRVQRAALGLCRAHLDLALARKAKPRHPAEAAVHLDTARGRLDALDTEEPSSIGPVERILQRMLARSLDAASEPGTAASASPEALLLAADGGWFQPPGGERVGSLQRRRAMRLLLRRLAEQRDWAPGSALSYEELLAAGWPGDRVRHEPGALRVRVAVSNLRTLGLRELLLHEGEGHFLDPRVRVRIVEA